MLIWCNEITFTNGLEVINALCQCCSWDSPTNKLDGTYSIRLLKKNKKKNNLLLKCLCEQVVIAFTFYFIHVAFIQNKALYNLNI